MIWMLFIWTHFRSSCFGAPTQETKTTWETAAKLMRWTSYWRPAAAAAARPPEWLCLLFLFSFLSFFLVVVQSIDDCSFWDVHILNLDLNDVFQATPAEEQTLANTCWGKNLLPQTFDVSHSFLFLSQPFTFRFLLSFCILFYIFFFVPRLCTCHVL